jgi:hypothetical protein
VVACGGSLGHIYAVVMFPFSVTLHSFVNSHPASILKLSSFRLLHRVRRRRPRSHDLSDLSLKGSDVAPGERRRDAICSLACAAKNLWRTQTPDLQSEARGELLSDLEKTTTRLDSSTCCALTAADRDRSSPCACREFAEHAQPRSSIKATDHESMNPNKRTTIRLSLLVPLSSHSSSPTSR